MADTTTNLGLTKPAQTDFYNVDVFNTNADLIDAAVKQNADDIISGDNEVKAWAKETFSNPNLFDNAYFLCPINTNGASTYTGAKDYIDKWKNFSATGSVDVTSNGLRFYDANGGTAYVRLNQIFSSDRVKLMSGKTVTVSLLVKGNYRFYIATNTAQTNIYGYSSDIVSDFTVITKTITLPESEYFRFELGNSNASECTIKWVKLELGTVATPFVSRGGNLERLQCQDVIPIANGGTGAAATAIDAPNTISVLSALRVRDYAYVNQGWRLIAESQNGTTDATYTAIVGGLNRLNLYPTVVLIHFFRWNGYIQPRLSILSDRSGSAFNGTGTYISKIGYTLDENGKFKVYIYKNFDAPATDSISVLSSLNMENLYNTNSSSTFTATEPEGIVYLTENSMANPIQKLLTGGEVSVVKSVTRGTVTATSDGTTVSIAISNVNKTVVLLDTGTNGVASNNGGYYSVGDGAHVSSVTTTGFTVVSDVRINPDKNITVGYQVIQYY